VHFEHRLFFAPEEALDAIEVWQGLATRIEHPQEFVLGLTGCDILERGPAHVLRRLHFGHDSYRDRVEWEEGKRLRFVVEPQDGRPGGTLEISLIIEGERLGLNFRYDTTLDEALLAPAGRPVAEWLAQAYAAADADTMACIVAIARKKRGKA
jgi:hypothetical protein